MSVQEQKFIGFLEWFMNQASHLINICSKWLYKMEGFYRQKDGTKKSEQKKRKDYFRPGTLPLGEENSMGFILPSTSLVQIWKFRVVCLMVTFLEEVELANVLVCCGERK